MSENFGKKTLRRSREQRILTGVCGGLGEYFGIDANLVRLAFVALTLLAFGGVLLYVVAWLVMPEEGAEASVLEHTIRNLQGKKSDL
ncbi:phage shock protein PspC (stress-responsive transcriptional regulator) [Lipingzhangella halophila]|uniref:Phage shock protein PspC (Stress-responsive transcriptional regulator) n=1 Tax=Lipingzhangella halophila TaxID=1783352 RepID=A0A7W7W502_9ACTN|nr:PspC domain-containing protein [Lipingzhangella halophila]MBB4934336.1 phage shock protein PspC (stress-responsive transcriptional regulator) [Lipingzhangella halophila]